MIFIINYNLKKIIKQHKNLSSKPIKSFIPMINKQHFDFLLKVDYSPQGNVGRNILNFGNKIQNIETIPSEFNKQLNRNQIIEICASKNYSNLSIAVVILAWGGMRFDHARNLFQNWMFLNPIIEDLRNGTIQTRKKAFEIFQNERTNGHLPGLGIGYFTKLICFVNPNLNGYILDQWSGKSINLLWNDPLVQISNLGWVTDHNTPDIYEKFCNRLEFLARELKMKTLATEEFIFSVGGRNPGQWRKYLEKNYPQKWF